MIMKGCVQWNPVLRLKRSSPQVGLELTTARPALNPLSYLTHLEKRVTICSQQIGDPKTRMFKVSKHIDNYANTAHPKDVIFSF